MNAELDTYQYLRQNQNFKIGHAPPSLLKTVPPFSTQRFPQTLFFEKGLFETQIVQTINLPRRLNITDKR